MKPARFASLPHLLLLSLLGACSDGEAQPGDSLQRQVDAILASGVVGVQAAVHEDGQRSWASGGLARIEGTLALEPTSQFRIASTTKTLVAATALKLVERGDLTLEDTVEQWLPGVVSGSGNDGSAITLRQLLQHTSGIANHVDDQLALLGAADSEAEVAEVLSRSWTPAELVALAMSHPPAFAPGDGWSYADTGYVLVGQIIAAATGESWGDSVRRHVVDPLELSRTFAPGATLDLPRGSMHGYSALPGGADEVDVTRLNPSALDAAGALVSTPSDLAHFFSALLSGGVVGAEALTAMKSTVATDDTDVSAPHYGLGLARVPSSCGGRWAHDGDTLGFHTRTGVSADGARSVVVAISGDADFEAPVAALLDEALCD